MVPMVDAASTAEKVHNREEFRQLLADVSKLPETQRSALLLREMDAMSYEEIAQAMETSVPSVKSLLVRARISLAEASQARQLTCGEVRLELAEAAEGLRKVSGPVRRHVRDCEECADFRSQVRSNDKVLAALFPAGRLVALKGFIARKLGLGGASGGAGAGGRRSGRRRREPQGPSAASAPRSGGSGAAGGIGAVGGAIGTKAVAGVVTAAVLTAGAVEVKQQVDPARAVSATPLTRTADTAHRRCRRADRPRAAGPAAAGRRRTTPGPTEPRRPSRRRRPSEHVAAQTPPRQRSCAQARPSRIEAGEAEQRPKPARRRRPTPTAHGTAPRPPAAAPSSSPSAARPPAEEAAPPAEEAPPPAERTAARRTGGEARRPRRAEALAAGGPAARPLLGEADHFEPPHQAGAGELARVGHRVAEQLPVVVVLGRPGRGQDPVGDRQRLLQRALDRLLVALVLAAPSRAGRPSRRRRGGARRGRRSGSPRRRPAACPRFRCSP